MRHSQIAMFLFFSASLSELYAAGLPKTVDCLQVSVVPNSADPEHALNPPQTRPGTRQLHMILTNVCSVDVTAFMLDINVTSPLSQQSRPGMDLIGGVARLNDSKFPWAGTEFPFDAVISGEPEDDPRPLELTVKVFGLIFRDGTAVGDESWVTHNQERRKSDVRNFAAELKLLGQIARLEDATKILKGDPDPSLSPPVRRFWLECRHGLSNNPADWAESISRTANWVQALSQAFSEHPELKMVDK